MASEPILPEPLPQHLKDWDCLDPPLFKEPWQHFSPFLASKGYTLALSDDYYVGPEKETSPPSPARDPFRPASDEAFIYRTLWPRFGELVRPGYLFFQHRSTGYLALDSQRREVFIKAVPADSSEWSIMLFLSSDSLRADPRNHTIPLSSIIPAGEWIFVVTACWGSDWDIPPFESVEARFEMARQLLEGLAFMHENGVGHGDIHPGNIVFNHDACRGRQGLSLGDEELRVPFHGTFDCRYAFIDFGSAVQFEFDVKSHTVGAGDSRPPTFFAAPEQDGESPFDLYAADVFNLGKTLLWELENAMKDENPVIKAATVNIQSYTELLQYMTSRDPTKRPSASEAVDSLEVAAHP